MRQTLWKIAALILVCAIVCESGCVRRQIRTIYVPDGAPVRLRQDVNAVQVWVQDAKGKWVPGVLDLKEGWYCLSDPSAGDPPK